MLDARDIEIAVDRQGHRARNRRRRHDEHVGREVRALFERRSLLDAEAMLLVRHDEAERGEGDRLLNQGMRADHDIDIVRLDCLVRRLALLLRQSSCQEQQPHGQISQQFAELVEMLTRQDFRRRHECALKAVFHRLDERQEGERRLTRADVALHEAAHRHGKLHILTNVAPRLFLILRQPKRQSLARPARKAARAEMAHALLLFTALAAQEKKPTLDEVKLLENQSFPREMQRLGRLGKMHLTIRLLSRDETIALADALGQSLHDLSDPLKDSCEKRAEKLLIQTARSRIDRQNAQIRFPAFFHQGEVLDLAHLLLAAPAEGIINLTDSEELHPRLELSLEELLIEERDLQKSRAVVNIDAQDMNAAPRAPLGYMTDDACDRLLLADRERGERRQHAPVFVCARIIGQEVIDGEEADLVQRLVFLRADALELQKTRLQLHGRPLSERYKT